jgi:putative drug exporter of the RND superfamily
MSFTAHAEPPDTHPPHPRPPAARHLAARAAGWSVRHRRVAISGWLLAVVIAVLTGSALGTHQLTNAETSAGEDARAQQVLAHAGFVTPAAESVLVQRPARGGTQPSLATDPAMRAAVTDVVHRVAATHQVGDIRAPYGVPGAARQDGQLSGDGRSVLVTFTLRGSSDTASDRVGPVLDAVAVAARSHPGLSIAEFGDASAGKALNATVGRDFHRAELMAVPISLGILLVVFGAVVAAILPVLLALTAFAGALGLLAYSSRLFPVDSTATSVMLLIGLAVGVDYALFYLRREREERARGASPETALEIAAQTSGHAVLTSGLTVAVAMLGLGWTGLGTFTGVGSGTAIVVGVAVLGSLTVLPAVMSALGDGITRLRVPLLGRRLAAPTTGTRTGRRRRRAASADAPTTPHGPLGVLTRHPGAVAGITAGLLVAVAVPALTMKTAEQGIDDLPRNLPIVATYTRVQAAFPGGPAPAVVVVSAPDVNAPAVRAAIADLRTRAIATHQMYDPVTTDVNPAGTVARVNVPLAGNGTDHISYAALRTLRHDVIPASLGRLHLDGVTTAVTGMTANSMDVGTRLHQRSPIVVAFVLALAFLLLLAAFRSAVVAAIAVALNALSVGAAYGLLVLVFQHHWADGLLGYTSSGRITNWLPLFLFVVLFGLSMDYQVFVLSRVREGVRAGMSPADAAIQGVRRSAAVVTSAATIMVAVFGVFGTLSQVSFKQLGFGLGASILLDATVVRVILLPAVLILVGDRAWRRDTGPLRELRQVAPRSPSPGYSGADVRYPPEDWNGMTPADLATPRRPSAPGAG